MNIGIITITGGTNYGNKLQNYAVVKTFEKLGHNAETIRNITNSFDSRSLKYRVKCTVKKIIGKGYEPIDRRRARFNLFSKNELNESRFIISGNRDNLERLDSFYDSFFSGSDQVWNPNYEYNTDIEYLAFAEKKKRNSFAVSFGVEFLNNSQSERIKRLLSDMNAISVREERAAEIVEELIGMRPFVSIDPTMMLDTNDWDRIKKRPQWKNDKPYILTYFLGNIDDEKKKIIDSISTKKGLDVVYLSGENRNKETNDEVFCTDPGEFVWLIDNSSLVLTDSFHATVFSILYKKPFRTFGRGDEKKTNNKSASRIETLLGLFDLKSHYENNYDDVETYFVRDFEGTENILAKEREKTYNFIVAALKGLDGEK